MLACCAVLRCLRSYAACSEARIQVYCCRIADEEVAVKVTRRLAKRRETERGGRASFRNLYISRTFDRWGEVTRIYHVCNMFGVLRHPHVVAKKRQLVTYQMEPRSNKIASTLNGVFSSQVQRPGMREALAVDVFLLRSFAMWSELREPS